MVTLFEYLISVLNKFPPVTTSCPLPLSLAVLPPAKSDKAPPVRAPEEYKPSMGEEYTGGEAAQKVKPKKGISFEIGSTPAKKRRPDSASK